MSGPYNTLPCYIKSRPTSGDYHDHLPPCFWSLLAIVHFVTALMSSSQRAIFSSHDMTTKYDGCCFFINASSAFLLMLLIAIAIQKESGDSNGGNV